MLVLGLLFLVAWAIGLGPARAQNNPRLEQSRYAAAAVYRYAEPDDVTIEVAVWGAVGNPGIYEVPQGIRLSKLFSAAGGPSVGDFQERSNQTLIVRLFRESDTGVRRVVYEERMEDEIIVGDENPEVQEGDVLTVERIVRRGVDWRDILSIGSSLVTLGLTIIRFVR